MEIDRGYISPQFVTYPPFCSYDMYYDVLRLPLREHQRQQHGVVPGVRPGFLLGRAIPSSSSPRTSPARRSPPSSSTRSVTDGTCRHHGGASVTTVADCQDIAIVAGLHLPREGPRHGRRVRHHGDPRLRPQGDHQQRHHHPRRAQASCGALAGQWRSLPHCLRRCRSIYDTQKLCHRAHRVAFPRRRRRGHQGWRRHRDGARGPQAAHRGCQERHLRRHRGGHRAGRRRGAGSPLPHVRRVQGDAHRSRGEARRGIRPRLSSRPAA